MKQAKTPRLGGAQSAPRRTGWSRDAGEPRRQPRAVGQPQLRVELQQRLEHETPHSEVAGAGAPGGGSCIEGAQQQHVHVHGPRAVARAAGLAPELALHRLAHVEQRLGTELGLDPQAGVEEVRLVEHLALRRRLVDRGRAARPPGRGAERFARGAQRGAPVSLVRAEPEVADPGQLSFQTSTETSSTGSGIGGSGLAALTRTASAPNRSIRRSATAAQSRSSVW